MLLIVKSVIGAELEFCGKLHIVQIAVLELYEETIQVCLYVYVREGDRPWSGHVLCSCL